MEPYRFTFNTYTEQIEYSDPWPKRKVRDGTSSYILPSSASFSSSVSDETSEKHLKERKFTEETDANLLTRPSRQSLRLAIQLSRKEAEQLTHPRYGDSDFSETPALSSGLPTSEEEVETALSIEKKFGRRSKKRARSPSFAEPLIETEKKARTLSSEEKKEEQKKYEKSLARAAGQRIHEGLDKLRRDQEAFLAIGQQIGSLIEMYQQAYPQTSIDARIFQIDELTPRQRIEAYKELVPQSVERMVGEFIETKRADELLLADLQEQIQTLEQENERLKQSRDAGGSPPFISDFAMDDFLL